MNKILKWTPAVIAALFMIWQENLYFKTIWELKIGSVNIWELNRLLPSLILFAILVGLYALILLLINKNRLSKSAFNSISLGIIAILSSVPIYLLLYINDAEKSSEQKTITYEITDYEMMSGGKYGKDYPSIFIDCGHPNKRLSLRGYSKESVYNKKKAILSVSEGYFGWDVIESINLE